MHDFHFGIHIHLHPNDDSHLHTNDDLHIRIHLDAEQLDARAELDEQLKKAIRELLVSVMSCPVGSPPFQSALLSFCAMGSG